jgi:hypothetical protein
MQKQRGNDIGNDGLSGGAATLVACPWQAPNRSYVDDTSTYRRHMPSVLPHFNVACRSAQRFGVRKSFGTCLEASVTRTQHLHRHERLH